ncbi:hypothetical protein ABH994_007472 [Bradyrhizobium yuanmingense]
MQSSQDLMFGAATPYALFISPHEATNLLQIDRLCKEDGWREFTKKPALASSARAGQSRRGPTDHEDQNGACVNSRHNLNTSNVQFGHGQNRIESESLIAALAAFTFVGCAATTTRLWPIDHNSARYFAALDTARGSLQPLATLRASAHRRPHCAWQTDPTTFLMTNLVSAQYVKCTRDRPRVQVGYPLVVHFRGWPTISRPN